MYRSEVAEAMSTPIELGPIDHIVELARKIMDEFPSCASRASEITTWAAEIRERRPSRGELEALIDATCGSLIPDEHRTRLVEGLRALVRFAE